MKQGIHPTWFDCQVTCSCGNTFITGSVQETMQVDICDKCHPFFTGEVRFVDRQGRVDRFLNKVKAAANKQQTQTKKQAKLSKQLNQDTPQEEPQSYRDLLREQQTSLRKSSKPAESN
jgi:large subunit ribosomal protein L31